MKKNLMRMLVLCLVLALTVCLFAGCGGNKTEDTAPAANSADTGAEETAEEPAAETGAPVGDTSTGGTIPGTEMNIVMSEDVPGLTPERMRTNTGYTLEYNIYEGLTISDHGDWDNMVGCLAESWEVSDDGLEYVFHLRQGVKFHDGSDFTAEDCIATFDYMQEQEPSQFSSIESWEAQDDYTFLVHMSQPYAYFIKMLGSAYFCILSADALAQYADTDIECAVGTGPYYVESYATGDKLVVKAFQDYWNQDEIPAIETLNFVIITDSNTAFMALLNGEVDYMMDVTVMQMQQAKAAGFNVLSCENTNNWILGLNTDVEPLDKIEVREAISCFLDKEAINMAGFDGEGFATNSTYIEASGVYADQPYEYNVEKGKELLASVGLTPEDLSFTLKCDSGTAEHAMAENIQAQLMAVGMNIELITLDVGPLNETRVTGDFEMNLYDTGGNVYGPLSSINQMVISTGVVCTSHFINTLPDVQAKADEMVNAANSAATMDEAKALGQEAMEYYQSYYPWIPVCGSQVYNIYSAEFTGAMLDYGYGHPVFRWLTLADA